MYLCTYLYVPTSKPQSSCFPAASLVTHGADVKEVVQRTLFCLSQERYQQLTELTKLLATNEMMVDNLAKSISVSPSEVYRTIMPLLQYIRVLRTKAQNEGRPRVLFGIGGGGGSGECCLTASRKQRISDKLSLLLICFYCSLIVIIVIEQLFASSAPSPGCI